MKIYRLYVAKPLLIIYLLVFGALIAGSFAGIIIAALGKFGPDGPPVGLFVILLGVALWNGYYWLRFPFEIKLKDDNSVEFRTIFRRTIASPSDIRSIRAKLFGLGFVDIVHSQGTVHLLNQIDGFHELVSSIKSINPAVEIKGC